MSRLLIGVLTTILGVVLFLRKWKLHKLIDTEGIATVVRVIDLGKIGNTKSYGIEYTVYADIPFTFFNTPVKKIKAINEKVKIRYQEQNPKNYYFPSKIFKIDKRLVPGLSLLILGSLTTIASLILLFG